MYEELNVDKLIKDGKFVKDFVIAKDLTQEQLIELAVGLQNKKSQIKEIYWLNGSDHLNYPSFESIKPNPRFIIIGNDIRVITDGLIFPQSEPIILVIENFHKLIKEDQDKYLKRICKLEDEYYYPHYYLHKESIVILGVAESFVLPKISYKLEIRQLVKI